MLSIHQRNAAIADVMHYMARLTADGHLQVAVICGAFVATCVHHNLSRETALHIVGSAFDDAVDLITLERPSRLS